MSKTRITITHNLEPIYSYKEEDWVKCPKCGRKLFKAIERKGSIIEITCRSSQCKKAYEIEV